MDTTFGVRILGLLMLFAVAPAFLDAQTSPDNRQVSVKRQILILLSHEWLESPSKISGTSGGAAFVCAAISKQGPYHLERKIPSAIATPKTYDEGVYESKLSDADLKTLLALVDDVEVKAYAGPPPQLPSDTWQFVIARTNGFQRIEISGRGKCPKGVEALKDFLRELDKRRASPRKGVAYSDCNPAKLTLFFLSTPG